MTLKEASERFCISMERLTYYEENKLIMYETLVDGVPDYTEEELHKVSMIRDLLEAGMGVNILQEYLQLLRKRTAGKTEQIRILRKQQCELMEKIHHKQQCLDRLDYMVDEIRKLGNSAGQAERSSTENDVQTQSSDTQTETESAGQSENVNVSGTENAEFSETQQPEAETSETQGKKVLVAYFSATGTTESVAEHIANGLNADIYKIIPEESYTDADLNYNDNNSRSTIEMNDPTSRPAISGSMENMGQYDIVFIGYPIWWGEAPRIVSTFAESYDFSGKTVVPFCTSGGSGGGSSASNLEQLTSGATWMEGRRLNGSDSQETVMEWVNSLDLNLGE